MPNVESIEDNHRELKICPYWRKFVVKDNAILALCGKVSLKEPRLPDTDLGPRLRRCPWYNAQAAYESPGILLCEINNLGITPIPIVHAKYPGAKGVRYVESVWNKVVQSFYKSHKNFFYGY